MHLICDFFHKESTDVELLKFKSAYASATYFRIRPLFQCSLTVQSYYLRTSRIFKEKRVLFSVNFAVVFDFMYFRSAPVKQNQ